MRCVTVPEIVQPYLRQLMILHEALEAARHYGGPVLRAVLLGIDVMIVCEPNANPQELFGLLGSIPAQFSDNHNRQRNQTTPAALGFLLDYFPLTTAPTGNDGELSVVQINGAPAQGNNFATSHPTKGAQQDRDEYWCASCRIDHFSHRLGVDSLHFLARYVSDVSFHLCLPRLDHGFRCMERSRSQFACFITRATLAAVSAGS